MTNGAVGTFDAEAGGYDAARRRLVPPFDAFFHEALAPGGVFVDAEQVAGPTPRLDELYRRRHHEQAAALGTTPEEWEAAERRMEHDRCATVSDQLAWLRQTGFADADCLFKHDRYAVLVARRP